MPAPSIPAAFRRVPEVGGRARLNPRVTSPLPVRDSEGSGGLGWRVGAVDAEGAPRGDATTGSTLTAREHDTALTVWSQTCESLENDVPRQTLVVSYSFTAVTTGDPYPLEVEFSGRLLGEPSSRGATTFSMSGRVHRVVPGCGRVTLTLRIPDLAAGEWEVIATPATDAEYPTVLQGPVRAEGATSISMLAPLVGPGLRIGGWPAMVGAGALVGVVVQASLAHRVGLPVVPLLWTTLLACVLGVFGAKLYYALTHPHERGGLVTVGMSLQGFVVVAFAVIVSLTLLLALPLGVVLDVSAPALLFGQAVGRIGCRFGGCCVGRPTASRWGVWSADRMVGVRRVPVRLMESITALVLAAGAAVSVILGPPRPAGWLFVVALSAYVVARQLLLPLREVPRATRYGRAITLTASAALLIAATVVLIRW